MIATGRSFVAPTSIITEAVSDNSPSDTAYINPSNPLNDAKGIYSNEPSISKVNSPDDGLSIKVTIRLSLSTSVSLRRTPGISTVNTSSSCITKVSLLPIGASFTGRIVISNVSESVKKPSLTVTVIVTAPK